MNTKIVFLLIATSFSTLVACGPALQVGGGNGSEAESVDLSKLSNEEVISYTRKNVGDVESILADGTVTDEEGNPVAGYTSLKDRCHVAVPELEISTTGAPKQVEIGEILPLKELPLSDADRQCLTTEIEKDICAMTKKILAGDLPAGLEVPKELIEGFQKLYDERCEENN